MPFWPWVSRVRLVATEQRLADCARERDYWQAKAEALIDAGLQRAGAASRPVFGPIPPQPPNPLAALMRGLAVSEIDSSQPKPPPPAPRAA